MVNFSITIHTVFRDLWRQFTLFNSCFQAVFSVRQKTNPFPLNPNLSLDHSKKNNLLPILKRFLFFLITSESVPDRAAEAVEAGECLARLDVPVLLAAAVEDSATELLSSRQDVISETECRRILAPPPAEESMSYSTTGVSMGTL